MGDPLKHIQDLARLARREQAPRVDVSRRVAAALRAGAKREEEFSLSWFAGFSAVAAALALVAVVPVHSVWSDPLLSVVANLLWGLL